VIVSLAYSFVLSRSRLSHSPSRSLARSARIARSLALPLSRFLPLRLPSLSLSLSLSFSLASLRRPLLADARAVRGPATVFIPRLDRPPRLGLQLRCDCALIDAPSRREGPASCRDAPVAHPAIVAGQSAPTSPYT